jgi:hypothetical protein
MKSSVPGSVVKVLLIVLFVAGSAAPVGGTSLAAPEPEPPGEVWVPGARVVRIADGSRSSHRVPPPRRPDLRIQSATFEVLYNPATCPPTTQPWPQEAKAAFEYAASIWGSLLSSSQTIQVIACWVDESTFSVSGWIGATLAVSYHQGFANAPIGSTYYPAALANALAGADLNGDNADVDGWFNADRNDWYFGTDGNPAPGELDFVSLVLHEVGHGLGFTGYAEVDTGDNACQTNTPGDGCFYSPPRVFDRFTEDGAGNPLLGYTNPSAALGNALTGQAGGVFFDGPQATAANGGPVKLYAPNPWNVSSYSHVDEQTYNNTPNSLMTPVQANGESEHHPGPVTLGMFMDMGWGAVNTPPMLAGLPDKLVDVDGAVDNAIDLWAYVSDGQSPASGLTYSIVGTPDLNAGISLDSNRYIDITPAAGWAGETEVTVQAQDPGGLSDTDVFVVRVAELVETFLPLVLNGHGPELSDWITIVSEDFEGGFPGSGWQAVDENASDGSYFWGRRDCRSSGGSYSAWSVGAGDTTLGCGSDYPTEVSAWMVYGPFSLADATAAELVFDWWSDTAGGDEFFYGASIDDYDYRGVHVTGAHASWTAGETFDLSAVPEFGSLLGQGQVWIGFSFTSDGSGVSEGTYVDNVVVRKRVGGATSSP